MMNKTTTATAHGGPIDEKANDIRERTAESFESAADSVRSAGTHGASMISDLADRAGEKLDSTATYVRGLDGDDLVTTLRRTVRRHPVGSMVLAIAVGVVAGASYRTGGSAG